MNFSKKKEPSRSFRRNQKTRFSFIFSALSSCLHLSFLLSTMPKPKGAKERKILAIMLQLVQYAFFKVNILKAGKERDEKKDYVPTKQDEIDPRLEKNKRNCCKICHEWKYGAEHSDAMISKLSVQERKNLEHPCSNTKCYDFLSCRFLQVMFKCALYSHDLGS
jgi:hypothetical protein